MVAGIQGSNFVKVDVQDSQNPQGKTQLYVNRKQVSSVEEAPGDTAVLRMQNGDRITVKASADETASLLSKEKPCGQNLDLKV